MKLATISINQESKDLDFKKAQFKSNRLEFHRLDVHENEIKELNLNIDLWGKRLYFISDGFKCGIAIEIDVSKYDVENTYETLNNLFIDDLCNILQLSLQKIRTGECRLLRSNGEAVKNGRFLVVDSYSICQQY